MLEADPNLKRSMTIHQDTVKILVPYYKTKEASTVQITLGKVFTKKKIDSQFF